MDRRLSGWPRTLTKRGCVSTIGELTPERRMSHNEPDPLKLPLRKILHIDADSFFASVEQRDNPSLRGKPVAVGYPNLRGVVAAASYEARKFGVHSALPSLSALSRCPDLVFVPPRFEVYREISQQMRAIFLDYTPLVEPVSLDEAYLDVTENLKGMDIATEIAEEIRARVKAETGLTVSAGASYCRFMAKMASDQRKPDGLFVIRPKDGAAFVASLPVGKFHGIGPATAARMESLGIKNGADMRTKSLEFLKEHFGKSGPYFHALSRGVDERPVNPNRVRKSIGAEDTFREDLVDFDEALHEVETLVRKVWAMCSKRDIHGRTVTLKVKYADFTQITRSRSHASSVAAEADMIETATLLLRSVHPFERPVRLFGVTLSGLDGVEKDTKHSGQFELAL
jgi:DNA polymerase-4